MAEKIEVMDKLIAALDTATPQVQIETRIIEATSTFVRNLGIQWGAKGAADPFYGNQTSLEFPNKIPVDGAMIPQGTVTRGIGGPLGGYAVNLPAAAFNTAVGVSFANVLDSFRLDLALSAMETEGTGRIVNSRRATTLNNKEAYIMQGRQIPVQTQANFTVTTQFFNAGLELPATPQITAEGTVIMTIDIQNNAADFANLVNGIPPITTQSAKTTVLVPDGGTTVIGGIYRARIRSPTTGSPSSTRSPPREPVQEPVQDADEPGAAHLHHPEDHPIGETTMKRATGCVRALRAAAALALLVGAVACNPVENESQSASRLILDSLTGIDIQGNAANFLNSDVVLMDAETGSLSWRSDIASASFSVIPYDPEPILGTSTYFDVQITRYTVTFVRSDGTKCPGTGRPLSVRGPDSLKIPVNETGHGLLRRRPGGGQAGDRPSAISTPPTSATS